MNQGGQTDMLTYPHMDMTNHPLHACMFMHATLDNCLGHCPAEFQACRDHGDEHMSVSTVYGVFSEPCGGVCAFNTVDPQGMGCSTNNLVYRMYWVLDGYVYLRVVGTISPLFSACHLVALEKLSRCNLLSPW